MIIDIRLPDIGSDEVEVIEIFVEEGEKVKAEQSLMTVEGNKALIEVPAPFSGVVKEWKVISGNKINTNSLIMTLEVEDENLPELPSEEPQNMSSIMKHSSELQHESLNKYPCIHATPIVRRLAAEVGIDLSKVKATGRKSRILKEDVQNYIKEIVKYKEESQNFHGLFNIVPWPKVDFNKFGSTEERELGHIKKISAAHLSRNWIMIPHVTHFEKIDITDLENFRQTQNIEIVKKKIHVRITLLVFIIKAISSALEIMPLFNSSLSEDGKKIILKKYINIGVAVDTPHGLFVPVLKDVNKKNITQLSKELVNYSQIAREGKLNISDMEGGCFTVSNLGGSGTTHFSPIINAPEVAILGISKATMQPVWNGKEFMARLILPISLSFDHRVIDGVDATNFLNIINTLLFDIRRLLL